MAYIKEIRVPIRMMFIPEKGPTMKVTYEIRRALVNGAKEDFDKASKQLTEAQNAFGNAKKIYDWATSINLGSELTSAPSVSYTPIVAPRNINARYFVPSKSGMTKGHYIVHDSITGFIDCTCPGFVNRGACWATNSLRAGSLSSMYLWTKSTSIFESNRSLAR